MCGAQNGEIDRFEFLRYVLVHTGRVDEDDVDDAMFLFHQYDLDGSGTIDIEDVHIFEKQKKHPWQLRHGHTLPLGI